jgi:hypothetical protein
MKFFEQNIGNIYFLDHLMRQNIINIYCCILRSSLNQNSYPNFQSFNGHLLIMDISKV